MSYATAGDSFDNLTMASVRTLQNASFSKTPLLLPCPGDQGQGMFFNGEQLSDYKRGIKPSITNFTQAPATVETLTRADLPTSGTCK